jgi:thiamine-phosphate pyrophosphorylase
MKCSQRLHNETARELSVFSRQMSSTEPASSFKLPRFYPILDSEVLTRVSMEPVAAVSALLEAGVQILQFRHKGFFSRDVVASMVDSARLCDEAGVLFVVNDRADFARILGAALHLGQDDLTPTAARRVTGPDAIIGYSTHNERQLREADTEPADYLALGPIFATESKRNPDPVVGIERLAGLRALTRKPLVAIGGISRNNAESVLAAGADSIAIISGLFAEPSVNPIGSLRETAAKWLRLIGS